MGENTGTVKLALTEKQAELFQKRIAERDSVSAHIEQLQQMIAESSLRQTRAQGKCDGIAEMVTEDQGYDFQKLAQYAINTEERTLVLTFKEENPVEPAVPTAEELRAEITAPELLAELEEV